MLALIQAEKKPEDRRRLDSKTTCADLFGEQRKHVVSHQVDRFGNGPNIDALFQTVDSTAENSSHIGAGKHLSFDQNAQEGQA
jgi:hypothetical protein